MRAQARSAREEHFPGDVGDVAIVADLRDAIVQGQLELFYQPVVSTATEKIAGFEALRRWRHPETGWSEM